MQTTELQKYSWVGFAWGFFLGGKSTNVQRLSAQELGGSFALLQKRGTTLHGRRQQQGPLGQDPQTDEQSSGETKPSSYWSLFSKSARSSPFRRYVAWILLSYSAFLQLASCSRAEVRGGPQPSRSIPGSRQHVLGRPEQFGAGFDPFPAAPLP